MKYGKRLICTLLAAVLSLLLFSPSVQADAAASAAFTQSVYAFRYGSTASVQARIAPGTERDWILQLSDGTELSRVHAGANADMILFTFPVTQELKRRSVLRLLPDGGEVLCEAQLICDRPQNGGLRQVATDRRAIAITFDAAGSFGRIYEIFDLLEQYNAKATFFVIGLFAERNPAEAQEIVARGHELASHSYEHLDMGVSDTDEIFQSLDRTDRLLRTFNGNKTVLYRPPSGLSVFDDRAIARALDSEVILWSIDSGDGFSYVSASDAINRTESGLHNGGIVLMHVYGHFTLTALKTILPYYAEQGYSFVTVSDLMLDGDTYIDAFGTQRALHHSDTQVRPIAERLQNGR
jgi:peptidoglycan/xylan/chitin deacetylase (PgdA/CDA1 family)